MNTILFYIFTKFYGDGVIQTKNMAILSTGTSRVFPIET